MESTTHIRITEKALKWLRMLEGEIQAQSGQAVTDNDAIEHLFQQYRPDIVERAITDSPASTQRIVSE